MLLTLLLACSSTPAAPSAETTAASSPAWPAAGSSPALLPVDAASGLSVLALDDGPEDVVIVALHGLGDRPEQFVRVARPWAEDATVLVPAAPDAWGAGGSWFNVRARSDGSALAEGVGAAADRLAALLAGRTKKSDHVVVTGFSQGGMLSFALAVRHPELVDLAVPIGGLLPRDLYPADLPADHPAVRALHGADDDRVPTAEAQATVAHLQSLGWDATLKTYDGVGHSISQPMRADLMATVTAAP